MAGGSVDYVNAFCERQIQGALVCEVDAEKGRMLRAQQPFEPGDRILSASPLLLVAEALEDPAYSEVQRLAVEHDFVHDTLWYWCALCSLCDEDLAECVLNIPDATEDQQRQLLFLYHIEAVAPSAEIAALVSEFWPRRQKTRDLALKLERLLSVWLLNCFEHSKEARGFSTFFLPSFLSHSCRPNSMWHYDGDDFVLRAREAIAAEAEVTVSYLAEEALVESTVSRRSQLEASKHFVCCCETCAEAVDRVRGFCCPSCRRGEVYLDVSGAAASRRGICPQCGFAPTQAQSDELAAQEAEVEKRMLEWERRAAQAEPDEYLSEEAAKKVERNMAGLFSSHHWLRDKAARHLAAYYDAVGRADLALHFVQQNTAFLVDTYPGYSAMLAWSLELQGDLKLRLSGFKHVGQDSVEAGSGRGSSELSKVWKEVGPIYAQASEILRVLFGSAHEFHTAMRAKHESLAKATSKRKGGASRRSGGAPVPAITAGTPSPLSAHGELEF